MDNVSVEETNDNLLAFENRGFAGAELIDTKDEMQSSTTSTLIISNDEPKNQLLDSFTSIKSEEFNINENILPQIHKTSIEAALCEQAELHQPVRGESSEISDEELVEYPKAKDILKFSQTNEDFLLTCTSPASQTSDSKNLTPSTSAQTIPTSASEYVTCKSNESVINSTGNLNSVASYLTANDKTLSVSHSDSTLSSDSGTLVDDRIEEHGYQQELNYDELDITPTKTTSSKINDFKDEEDEEDSSSMGDYINRTIISNVIKEPYDTEISLSTLSGSFINEPFTQRITQHEITKQHTLEFSTKSSNRLSFSETQSESDKCSIETAIYKGGESELSSFESTTNEAVKSIKDEQMPSIMSTGNLDEWDDNNLDDEMIIHDDVEEEKKSTDVLYTLEEEEESKGEDTFNKSNQQQQHQQQQHQLINNLKICSSADNSSSLMEFERLENEVDQGSTKLLHHSSLDSIGSIGSAGMGSTPKIMNLPQSDNTSVNSLNEFERLEKEVDQEQQDSSKIKLLTEIEEGHESQASDTIETISGRSIVKKEEDDDSEIELELNAKLDVDDIINNCATQQQIVDELSDITPIHKPQQLDPSTQTISTDEITKEDSTYDEEEILKIITTTENRIIEETIEEKSGNEDFETELTMTSTIEEINDGITTQTTIRSTTTTTTTSTSTIDENELDKYLRKDSETK